MLTPLKALLAGSTILLLGLNAFGEKETCTWCVSENSSIKEELTQLSKKDPKEILKAVRSQGICIKILKSNRKHPEKLFYWGKVEPGVDELSSVTKQANLMGKTLCKGEKDIAKDCTTIFLASDAPFSTLFHELLHAKQIEKDKEWCALSKKLWSSPPEPPDEIEIRNKEWDAHKFLWEHRDALNFGIEDKVTIADETLREAKARQSFDKSSAKYLESQDISAKLAAYISEYMKELRGTQKSKP